MEHDIQIALRSHKLLETFEALAPSHQREYLQWIEQAKKPETRARRIKKMCEVLATSKKDRR